MLNWLRELGATVGSFDRSAVEPGYALRCTIGVAIPLVLAALAGQPALGVAAALGAFITGFTSLQGIYRTRLTAILAAAFGMCATSFVGAIAAHSTPGLVVATAVAGYAFGTLGQLGPAASTIALNSFVAFVLFSSQALSAAAAAQQSFLVLCGGLIQALLLLFAWLTARRGVERATLADVYRNLATYARAIADGSPTLPPITPLATARQVLADPQPFARAAEIARFNRLFEDSDVIRRRLGAWAAWAADDGTAAIGVPASRVAEKLDAIADVLVGNRDDVGALDLRASHTPDPAGILDVSTHLRDAAEAAAMLASGRIPKFGLLSKPRPAPYVRNHIDWLSRDSLRFALVLAIAMALGRHFAADRGYWIPLTAALVLKPDFQTTFVRGAGRIGGTLAGAVVANVVISLVHGHVALKIAGILAAAAAAYLTFNPNYALFTVAITSFVVIVLSLRGLPGSTTIEARLLDTVAGGALAMIGYVLLPSWEHHRTRGLLADLLDAQRGLAVAILQAYASPSSDARNAIAGARNEVWKVRTMVEASIDRTRQEPRHHHRIGAARALRILAATQRFALASLALETMLETERPATVLPLVGFIDALDAEMVELAAALRQSRRARPARDVAAATARLESELATTGDPNQRPVLEELRAYDEATARIARLVGVERN